MWRTPRGLRLAEATAFQTTPRSDRVRIPLVLAGTEYFRQNAFGSQLSREQDEIVWSTLSEAFTGILDTGQVSSAQVIQLGLAWRGTSNLLGWAGVARTLAPDLRLLAGYAVAHRNLRLGNRPQAESMLRQALKEAPPDSPLARLCQEDLKLIQSQQGRLIVRCELDAPATVKVLQGGREVALVEATVDLPPGDYELQRER